MSTPPHKRERKELVESTLRVLGADELAKIEDNWERSDECKRLREKQALIREKIEQKSGAYSNRC